MMRVEKDGYVFDTNEIWVIRQGEWPKNLRKASALDESIHKWGLYLKFVRTCDVRDRVPMAGSLCCALCELYARNDCRGCPVNVASHRNGCETTPYGDYDEAISNHLSKRTPETFRKLVRSIRAEIRFLKGLRKP